MYACHWSFRQTTNFIAAVGEIDVKPDVPAKIIINERTGTIVATQNVRISPVAVSSSNVTIFLNPTTGVSQPLPFSKGATEVIEGEMLNSLKKWAGSNLSMSLTHPVPLLSMS